MTPNERTGLVKAVAGIIRDHARQFRVEMSALIAPIADRLARHEIGLDELKGHIRETQDRIDAIPEPQIGPQGPSGEKGIDGAIGPMGLRGERGERGETGERGLDGAVGHEGAIGPMGLRGEKGDPGERGEKGEPGPSGEKGIDGKDGRDGRDGIAKDGRDGEPGKDALQIEILDALPLGGKTVPRGTFLRRDGGIVRARKALAADEASFSEGWDVVVDGIADISISQSEDLRSFTMIITRTSGKGTLHQGSIPTMLYREGFKDGHDYERGDVVTYEGAMWVCRSERTHARPANDNKDWVLSVRRGQAGRDLRPDEPAQPPKPIQLGQARRS